MSAHASEPEPPDDRPPKSFGNLSEHHWSVARREHNREALDYYRERSKAPGVASGGAERNFYCMSCDGVIPFDFRGARCPHCDAELDEHVKRYFNWVEINEPPKSDALALLLIALPFVIGAALIGLLAWYLLNLGAT